MPDGLFRIEGLEEAIKRTQALTGALEVSKVERVLMRGARIVAEEAERRIGRQFKVKTGNLGDSTRKKKRRRHNDNVAGAFAAIDRKVAPHAHLLEFGTSKMAAKPFFRPSVDATREQVKDEVEAGLRDLLKGANS